MVGLLHLIPVAVYGLLWVAFEIINATEPATAHGKFRR